MPLCSRVSLLKSIERINMSKVKAIKKPRNEKLINNLKLFFSSLISNDACVTAREKPWYAAVAIGLISILLAVLPISVASWKQKGSDILSSPTYGVDTGLVAFQETVASKNLSIKVNGETHKLELSQSEWDTAFGSSFNTTSFFSNTYTETVTYIPTTTVVDSSSSSSTVVELPATTKEVTRSNLLAFYVPADFSTTVTTMLSDTSVKLTANTTVKISKFNCLFLGTDSFKLVKVAYDSSTDAVKSSSVINGSYSGPTFAVADLIKQNSYGTAYTVPFASKNATNIATYTEESLNAWKTFFNDSWEQTRVTTGWKTSGIWLGIFAGVVVFMGLMVFLMTRGKENPYRIYTFWQCEKIAYWAALTPGLLALILGFIWTNFLMFYFIFLFGLRIMWMSMRSLRPYQQ